MTDFVGHEAELQLLWQKIQNFQSGTFLLSGPEGIGKRTGAWKLIQKVFCDHQTGCGTCPSCRQVDLRQYPSILEIQPEGNMIRVEEGQKVLHYVGLRKLTAKSFVVIDEVQMMNSQTSNMLLKTLEEPPEGLFFLLVTSQRTKVLRTIQSRSQLIRFKPLTHGQLRGLVAHATGQELQRARGSVSRLHEIRNDEFAHKWENGVRTLDLFLSPDFLTTTAWRDEWKGREQFDFLLRTWEFEIAERVTKLMSKEEEPSPQLRQLQTMFQGLQKIKADLVYHPDQALTLESFWVRVLQTGDNLAS